MGEICTVSDILLNSDAVKDAIAKAEPVFIVKDESDLKAALPFGIAATTCPNGYSNWSSEHSEVLRHAKVYIFFTKDIDSRMSVKKIALSLAGIAAEVNACEVLDKGSDLCELRHWIIGNNSKSLFNSYANLSRKWSEFDELMNVEKDASDGFINLDSGGDEKKDGLVSQSKRLYDLFADSERFHDQFNKPFLVIGNESIPIRSRDIENILLLAYKRAFHEIPSPDAVKKVLRLMEAEALVEGKEYHLELRISRYDNDYYYDLCDSEHGAVKFNSEGWVVVNQLPIIFRRQSSMQKRQVVPQSGKSIFLLQKYLNVKKEQFLLILVWIVSAFIPDIPHSIPNLHGSQGSAKTTATKVLKRIIDPSSAETLIFAKDINELVQQLSHQYLCCYDNLNGFKDWVSDVFCRAVTGEGFTKRELYSDDSDVVYAFRRCLCLNGICIPANKADLLDRSILFELDRIDPGSRKEERQFWNEFEKDLPYILGSIFDVLVGAIRLYPTIQLDELNRMADFTRWGAAIAESILPGGKDEFLKLYTENIESQNEEALNADSVAIALIGLLNEIGSFDGSVSDLFSKLSEFAEKTGIGTSTPSWPQDVRILGKKLKVIKATIAYYGYEMLHKRGRASSKITIFKQSLPDKEPSAKDISEDDATNATITQPSLLYGIEDL